MIETEPRSPPVRRKKDPRIRRDSLCVVCKKERPEMAVKGFDPFCSATCCREWHGVKKD